MKDKNKRLEDLRRRQGAAIAESRELIDRAEAENRELTGDEKVHWDTLIKDGNELHARISTEERQVDLEEYLTKPRRELGLPDVGLEDVPEPERRQYSLFRALTAHDTKDWSKAPFERECSDRMAKTMGREARGFFVPHWGLRNPRSPVERRDVTAATEAAAAIGTDLLAGSFIDILRPTSRVIELGATVLNGLVGDVSIPRQNAAVTAAWVATEAANLSEGQLTTDAVSLTPKDVGVYTEITRRAIQQATPGIEALVRADIAAGIGTAIDIAAINGSGSSGVPQGIIGTSGIGDVTTGGVLVWADVVELETDVNAADALMGRMGYLMRAELMGIMKQTLKVTGVSGFLMETNGTVNGYRALTTQNVPTDITVSDQALIFGDWSSMLIGEWGGLDLLTDPYSLGIAGSVRIIGFQTIDTGVRHAASFSVAQDIT